MPSPCRSLMQNKWYLEHWRALLLSAELISADPHHDRLLSFAFTYLSAMAWHIAVTCMQMS